ncbi:MAG TPA: amino acid adenylation domain-containing protein [Longimicrobium sp.]|nr:amino acid adenylation domain-containing protein [Longimicrobium sp.]
MQQVIEGFRPSPRQRRLLAIGQGRGGGGTMCGVAARVRGPLDGAALRSALDAVVAGSEILRTLLVREPRSGVPLQVIGSHAPAWDDDADWTGLTPAEVEHRLGAWSAETRAAAADFARAPLVSAALARLGAGDHLFFLRVPAALADAGSLAMVVEQLAAACAGSAPEGEGMQFADVSEWQNELRESDEGEEGRRFWKQRRAADTPLRFPHHADGAGGEPLRSVEIDTEPELLARLEAAAGARQLPASTLVLAGWTALAHRLTGHPSVGVGVEVDGRGFEELRGVLGPFAHFLPVTAEVADEMPVAELAAALQAALAVAGRWGDAFPAADGGEGEPIAPIGFAWHPLPATVAGGVEWRVVALVAAGEPFAAALLCAPGDGRLNARLAYDPASLADAAAARLAEEVATVLRHLAADPSATVGALEVVGPRERAWIGAELEAGPELPDDDRTVLDRILARAAASPGIVAVRWERGEVTYGELRDRVEELAAALRALGVGRETRVGILLDRSADAVAAILATMRAGGAYVPLDAAFPAGRLAYMLRDSGAAVLVTDGSGAALGYEAGCRVLRADQPLSAEAAPDPAAPATGPEHAAYVVYTSGTTGRPKGTVVEHRALARYTRAAVAALDLPEGASYAVVSTLAADLGSTMLFPALVLGGTLHLVAEHRAADPDGWAAYAAEHDIDCLKIVPSHLHMLLDATRPAGALPRQRLVLGGEACPRQLLERVRALAPGCRIFNHYGPTETTVGVVVGELAEGDGGAPPLGRPLPGACIHLLDTRGRPAPAGVPGEAHVGGGTLARCYLGRPALTAERFVPDPFSARPGARLYRTGDRARWRADGQLEFLGRLDDQVKVNGWRVEPAEVEAVLAAHPGVAACRVVAREGGGARRLAAYVVPRPDAAAEPEEFRAHLRQHLPEPFIPADFVLLPRLPLTLNGKVDLRALPDPAAAAPRQRVEPRTPAEAALAAIWEEVLEKGGVGVTDDFFALGGNSFLAVRLMSRIQKTWGRRLPLAALIAAATVERMVALVEEAESESTLSHLVEIRPGGPLAPLVCVHPGEGTVLCYRGLALRMAGGRPLLGVQALDFEMERAPLVSIEELAARYVEALAERDPAGPYVLGGWSFGGLVAFEMARQLVERGAEVRRLLLFDCRLPVTGPALSAVHPALHRLTMLFHGALLVRDGRTVVRGEELAELELDEQLELVAARAGVPRATLLPRHVPPDQLERYLALRVARTQGVLDYAWRPTAVPTTLFRAAEVELDTLFPEMREAYERAALTPDYGWGALTSHLVEVVEVPGTHHTMFSEPHVRELARAVEHALAGTPVVAVA